MTADVVAAVFALAAGLGLAAAVVGREARRSGLGIAHPAVPWLALHAVFFGVGGAVLAVAEGAAGQAAYTGLAAAAFAGGLWASGAVARTRGPRPERPEATVHAERPETDVRLLVAALLAAASVALVVPILVRTGLPFLAGDITGARAELAGLVVQPLRVALPAMAVAWLLRARRRAASEQAGTGRGPGRRTAVQAAILVAVIGAFELLLASRYFAAELAGAIVIGWLLDRGRPSWRLAGGALLFAVAVFGAVQLLRAWDQAGGNAVGFVVERTVNRVILVQPRTLDAIMTAIPAQEPFFGGLGWLHRLGPLLGHDVPNLGYWIYPRVVGDAQAVAGYAAPGLIGEAWANLGWAGLGLFVGLGAFAERLAALIRRHPGEADLTAAALVVLFLARTHALGLGGLSVLVVLVAAWRLAVAPRTAPGREPWSRLFRRPARR